MQMPGPDLDFSFFKVLSRNDTGETGGHQGGIVIPKAIAEYFPLLRPGTTATVDHDIHAELYRSDSRLGDVLTRFQLQTWGGTRPGEYRLTRNLHLLLDAGSSGDIVLFQRFRGELDRFRIMLVPQGTAEYQNIRQRVGTRRWGTLDTDEIPLTAGALTRVQNELTETAQTQFEPFEPEERVRRRTTANLLVRDEAFRALVRRSYNSSCAVCGIALRTPSGAAEVQAAHVIPVAQRGTHDPRNGLCLCRTHHWTFDNGLFGLTDEYTIYVPGRIRRIRANTAVSELQGRTITVPRATTDRPAPEALEWHRRYAVIW